MNEEDIEEEQGTQKDIEEVLSLCEEQGKQKVIEELQSLCGGQSNQDLCDEMDELCEDLKRDKSAPENMAPVDQIAQPINLESPEEPEHDKKVLEGISPLKKDEEPNNLESSDETHNGKGFMATYWLLIMGIALAAIGMFGVIGLRLNIVQMLLLGIDNPFPGIGSVEPRGHITSIIPFAIGIVAICAWGFILGQDEEIEKFGGNSEPVEKEMTANLKLVETQAFGFEHPSSHRYI